MILRLAALVLAMLAPATAHADWHEASTKHFVVYANDRPEAIERFAAELEKFNSVMAFFYPKALVPNEGPANRVSVFVLSGNGMEKLTGSDFTRGFYIPRAGGNVAFVPRVSGRSDPNDLSGATVLRHEYAHHFMYSRFPAVFPIWFSEGFAEYWSTVRFDGDGSAVVGLVPQHRGYGLLTGNPLPLAQLLTLTNRKLNQDQQEAIYGRGWLLTHYLMSTPEGQKQLGAYMAAINQGQSLEKAAEALGDLKVLGRTLEKYMSGTMKARQLNGKVIATPSVTLRKLTPGESATMAVRIESKAGVDEQEARKVLADARKAAAPFPNDPGAQVALAEAEFDAGNYAEAEAAAARALAVAPNHGEALMYRAWAKFEIAERGNGDTAAWREVRRAIAAANRNDPEDPRPLILYYRTFQASGEAPSQVAKDGLAKAYYVAPADLSLRMNAAAMFLYDNKPLEAREALRLIAFHPHGGEMAAKARAMIAAIERKEAADKVMAATASAESGN
jgi:tetratricopeptide (TPR) repeat protein